MLEKESQHQDIYYCYLGAQILLGLWYIVWICMASYNFYRISPCKIQLSFEKLED